MNDRLCLHCVYVVTLQACLDNGYFTPQIVVAKVGRSITMPSVKAGIFRSDRTALTFGTPGGTRGGFGVGTLGIGFGVHFGFGTPLDGYVPARAGSGKLGGTGGSGWTGEHAVQFPGDSVQERR